MFGRGRGVRGETQMDPTPRNLRAHYKRKAPHISAIFADRIIEGGNGDDDDGDRRQTTQIMG